MKLPSENFGTEKVSLVYISLKNHAIMDDYRALSWQIMSSLSLKLMTM